MVVLNKIATYSKVSKRNLWSTIKAATLVETLVASVLIMLVFSIASLTLNNVFISTIKNNTHGIETYIDKLAYLYHHNKIQLGPQDSFNEWEVSIEKKIEDNNMFIVFDAVHSETKKTISKKIIDVRIP